MMLDPETRSVYRAEEQMSSGSWKHPDPDEKDEVVAPECMVCHAPLVPFLVFHALAGTMVWRNPTRGQKVCRPCNVKGWRSKPCVRCGGPTQTWAWSSKARKVSTRGMCGECRKAWHLEKELIG